MSSPRISSLLTEEIRSFIGRVGPLMSATESVEAGFVRRFSQAIMDNDPAYHETSPRYLHLIAPALLPPFLFVRPFGSADLLSERAKDPDFDGSDLSSYNGLPELPVPHLGLLNGGAEVEFFRHVRHGEKVVQQSEYLDIQERSSSKGPMLIVRVRTRYTTSDGDPLLTIIQVDIRR